MNNDNGNGNISSSSSSSSSKNVATSTAKMYSLSGSRDVIVGRRSVVISDETTKKFVNLSLQRWAKLRELTPDVDTAVERIVKNEKGVFYRRHLGATWFVTVRSGVWCIDIRKHFNCPPSDSRDGDDLLVIDDDDDDRSEGSVGGGGDVVDRLDLKPTRVGLGLRIREWRALKEIASIIESTRLDIANATSCFHPGQNGNETNYCEIVQS